MTSYNTDNAIKFKDLVITTMTQVNMIQGSIDIMSAFHLLPITKMILKNNRDSLKCKLPLCETRGAILSMRHKKMVRGIIRNTNEFFFKNSITLDISTAVKNISLKISPNTIQLCGACSRQNGIEAATYIIDYLIDIKKQVDYIENHLDSYNECIAWLNEAKGVPHIKIVYEEFPTKNLIYRIRHEVPDYLINFHHIPLHLDHQIMTFLISLSTDMTYHSDFMNKINNILKFKPVYEGDLAIYKTNEVMVNYNYNLGFRVNRDRLNELIDGKNGLYSHYDNALVNSVTVELPYDTLLDYTSKKLKRGISHHTFLIYGSGAVTQSGPCSSSQPGRCSTIMEEAFNTFMSTIMEIKDEIML